MRSGSTHQRRGGGSSQAASGHQLTTTRMSPTRLGLPSLARLTPLQRTLQIALGSSFPVWRFISETRLTRAGCLRARRSFSPRDVRALSRTSMCTRSSGI